MSMIINMEMMSDFRKKSNKFIRFIRDDIWFLDFRSMSRRKSAILSLTKILAIIFLGLIRNNCLLQASALTFISLMSLVPLLAFVFSVAKGLNAQEILLRSIADHLTAMPAQIRSFIQQIFDLVDSTDFTALGIIGLFILFWSIIKVLGTIEKTFNAIWGVEKHRPLIRKLSDYLLVMLIGPLIIMLSSALIAMVFSGRFIVLLEQVMGRFFILYHLALGFSGVLGIIITFAFLYGYLPNTKVRFLSAVGGGIVAGVIWYGTQLVYIKFQISVTSYNAIYGAFATLPIFLIWLYLDWIILLLGAEFSFAIQNYKTYTPESALTNISFSTRLRLASMIVGEICEHFEQGKGGWHLESFQERNYLPVRLIKGILCVLRENKVILEVEDGGFVPGEEPANLNLKKVYSCVGGVADDRFLVLMTVSDKHIIEHLDREENRYLSYLSQNSYASGSRE